MEALIKARQVLMNETLDGIKANRHWLPYCFQLCGDRAVPVNRRYEPIGENHDLNDIPHYEYEKWPGVPAVVIEGLTVENWRVWLYSDNANPQDPPWASHEAAFNYLQQLESIADRYALSIVNAKGEH